MRTMMYFATDGNYGEATNMVMLRADDLTQADWDEISSLPDLDRYRYAQAILTRLIREAEQKEDDWA